MRNWSLCSYNFKMNLPPSRAFCILPLLLGIFLQACLSSSVPETPKPEMYKEASSDPNFPWTYARVKRQLYREQIPHHRPLTGNNYARHVGYPQPGRWHSVPGSIIRPNPNSGHHFDSPNVILTEEDFQRFGSTLQHLDHGQFGGTISSGHTSGGQGHDDDGIVHHNDADLPIRIIHHHHYHKPIIADPIEHPANPSDLGKLAQFQQHDGGLVVHEGGEVNGLGGGGPHGPAQYGHGIQPQVAVQGHHPGLHGVSVEVQNNLPVVPVPIPIGPQDAVPGVPVLHNIHQGHHVQQPPFFHQQQHHHHVQPHHIQDIYKSEPETLLPGPPYAPQHAHGLGDQGHALAPEIGHAQEHAHEIGHEHGHEHGGHGLDEGLPHIEEQGFGHPYAGLKPKPLSSIFNFHDLIFGPSRRPTHHTPILKSFFPSGYGKWRHRPFSWSFSH